MTKANTKAQAEHAQHTPLTDQAEALPTGFYSRATVPSEFARRLERDRADLLQALKDIAECAQKPQTVNTDLATLTQRIAAVALAAIARATQSSLI